MAVVFALRHFRVYLLELEFKVITNCNALRTTFAKRDLLPRIGRWWLKVQEYTFDIEYRAGSRMSHVNALSKNPVSLELEAWRCHERRLDINCAIKGRTNTTNPILLCEKPTGKIKHYFDKYLVKNDNLYRRKYDETNVWVVSRDARMQICWLCRWREAFKCREDIRSS